MLIKSKEAKNMDCTMLSMRYDVRDSNSSGGTFNVITCDESSVGSINAGANSINIRLRICLYVSITEPA